MGHKSPREGLEISMQNTLSGRRIRYCRVCYGLLFSSLSPRLVVLLEGGNVLSQTVFVCSIWYFFEGGFGIFQFSLKTMSSLVFFFPRLLSLYSPVSVSSSP